MRSTDLVRRQLFKDLKREDGFTLPEMMVTMLIMLVVLFALYSIFDMSIKVFSFGNDKVEATENARVSLERMEREIRAAFPYNPTTDARVLDASGSPPNVNTNGNKITFFNETTGDDKADSTDEKISFYVDNGNLVRQRGTTPEILTALGTGGQLEFAYFGNDPTDLANCTDLTAASQIEITPSTSNEECIRMVRIKLVVDEDGREQELITNAALRNRGA